MYQEKLAYHYLNRFYDAHHQTNCMKEKNIYCAVRTFFNFSLIGAVAKSLTSSLVNPIYELQRAVQQIKVGDFDININYESQDKLGVLADGLRWNPVMRL